ncbi:MAG: DnaJ C-terminal domain-containing protein, partial [Myxococcota bacterium]|nr:DnaJ C-terminal domain-containing protein [Myxococcota bacterium]
PPGDLYVFVAVKKHELFQRDGQSLHLRVPISFVQAALGAQLQIPTLDGEQNVDIKAGTQPGEQLVLEKLGVPRLDGSGRGPLIITLDVKIPRKLNAKQRELLEAYAAESGESVKAKKEGLFSKLKSKSK